MEGSIVDSFLGSLLVDVAGAQERHRKAATQSNRREIVRTAFAALEGQIWIFREHVVESIQMTYGLEADEEFALAEVSYQITEQGRIHRQPKFVSMLATVRFIARLAERITPNLAIDFSGSEWEQMRSAIKIRNRITHPKSQEDLILTQVDVESCLAALFWLLEQTSGIMAAANVATKDYIGQFDDVLQKLKSGDPEMTLIYEVLKRSSKDD